MTERIGSRLCEKSIDHFSCSGCSCWCHEQYRTPDPVWDSEPVQDGCRGTHWTPDRDTAA
jgi:hypothetical protein